MADPLTIHLEFSRMENVSDPYGFSYGRNAYMLRRRRGQFTQTNVDWSEAGELLEKLAAMQAIPPRAEVAQWLGEHLDAILSPAGFGDDRLRIANAVREGRPVRIDIVSAAAELYALPWELLALQTGERLCQIPDCLLRYEWPDTDTAARPRGGGFAPGARVLLAWSARGGPVPAEEHAAAIRAAGTDLSVLPDVSSAALAEALDHARREAAPFTVLHLLCHGTLRDGAAQLVWDDGEGDTALLDPNSLARLLGPFADTLRVVMLCACHSGQAGQLGSRLGSLAQAVHRGTLKTGRFEAVVASRFPFSVDGSILLAEAFYPALLRDGLDAAVLAARQRMDPMGGAGRPGSFDHASLQLYASPATAADGAKEKAGVAANNGRRVLMVGTGTDPTAAEITVARAAAEAFARTGYGLVSGGWPGVDWEVTERFRTVVEHAGLRAYDRITQVLENGRLPAHSSGRVERVQGGDAEFSRSLELADAVVLIGGRGATYEMYQGARRAAKPVFALADTGGDAKRAYFDVLGYWPTEAFRVVDPGAYSALATPIEADARKVVRALCDLIGTELRLGS